VASVPKLLNGLTAAGTAPVFHGVPFAFYAHSGNKKPVNFVDVKKMNNLADWNLPRIYKHFLLKTNHDVTISIKLFLIKQLKSIFFLMPRALHFFKLL
jgi:hypothetical protein